MKSTFLKFAFLFIATSCICGICSKNDAGSDNNSGNNNNNVEPVLKPDDTWLYFEDAPSLVFFHSNNNHPQSQKWVATKINQAYVGMLDSSKNIHFLTWSFENTGATRFVSNTLNPNGKEAMSILLKNVSPTPGPATYTMDIDFKQGLCWYYVYNSAGSLFDSTRYQDLQTSTLNITKMDFYQALGSVVNRYKMIGTATFNVMYWQSGTSSTSDIHTLQCHFNNVFIDFPKK